MFIFAIVLASFLTNTELHIGQFSIILNGTLSSFLLSNFTSTTSGITSPAFLIEIVSPTLTSLSMQ